MGKHKCRVKHTEEVRFSEGDHELPFRLDIYELMSGKNKGRFVGIVSQMVEDTDILDTPNDIIEQSERIVACKTLAHSIQAAIAKR